MHPGMPLTLAAGDDRHIHQEHAIVPIRAIVASMYRAVICINRAAVPRGAAHRAPLQHERHDSWALTECSSPFAAGGPGEGSTDFIQAIRYSLRSWRASSGRSPQSGSAVTRLT